MIDWLYGLQHFGMKLGLDNIRRLLELLERPDRSFPSVVVGGTNGKGSVGAMLHAMLLASGVETGLFTSPHLVRPNERIRVGREEIDDAALAALLGRLRDRIEAAIASGALESAPSFFEVITAAALLAFEDRALDAAILEVGLGGRLDATNAVDANLAVVVSVDLDHTKSLGDTIPQIAYEKAGIIKENRALVSGAVRQGAINVLRRTCRERSTEWIDARSAVRFESEGADGVCFHTREHVYRDLVIGLPGRHQIDNARVALAAYEQFARTLGISPDPGAVREALAEVRWHGRLQWVDGPDRTRMLLDGAHNPAGAATLADYLSGLDGPRPVVLFGAMHGKLLDGMLAPLAPWVGAMVVTRPDVRRAADPEEVAAIARTRLPEVEVVADPREALKRAIARAEDGQPVLVTGSLYLVGQVLAMLDPRPAPGPVSM